MMMMMMKRIVFLGLFPACVSAFLPQQQSQWGLTKERFEPQLLNHPRVGGVVETRTRTTTRLFASGDTADKVLDMKKQDGYELARYDTGLAAKDYDALFEYMQLWAKEYFTTTDNDSNNNNNNNKKKLLATPVKIIIPTMNDVAASKSIKIVFQKTDTGFTSSKDERRQAEDDDKDTTNKKKKKAPPKQGGVEILVEKLHDATLIRAVRCEMDDDTMIKEMSEETILEQLKKAITVWKKDHASSSSSSSSSK
jgi:hypothetical protein